MPLVNYLTGSSRDEFEDMCTTRSTVFHQDSIDILGTAASDHYHTSPSQPITQKLNRALHTTTLSFMPSAVT